MTSERIMETTPNNLRKLRDRAFYTAACGSIALLAMITGCDKETPPLQTPTSKSVSEMIDSDGDGILNIYDRQPNIADPQDVDNDGLINSQDLYYPYDPTNGVNSTRPLSTATTVPVPTSSNTTPCIRYAKPDKDGDSLPDYCDPIYNSKDSDGDGLYDYEDSAPHTRDRDNDGRLDGQDRQPNMNQKREQEKRDAERREQQRLEQKRLEEKRLEEQRRRDRDGY